MLILPLAAFWTLIIGGMWIGEISLKEALVFVVIWTLLLFGLPPTGASPYVFVAAQVVLDIVLLFKLKLAGS